MLPVFTAAEMRALDQRAMTRLGIPGIRLMENAGRGATRAILAHFGSQKGKRVVVCCGKGNNGGDGFVVARGLKAAGARVSVFLVARAGDVRGDSAAMLAAYRRARGAIEEVTRESDLRALNTALASAHLVVDGLLGTGLTGPATGLVAAVIEAINTSGKPVVALDLPSGLASDHGRLLGPAVRAVLTTTFAGWKRGLLLHPGAARAGQVRLVDIGIPDAATREGIGVFLLESADIAPHFPPRPPDAHKGTFGHLLVVAGSVGKTGAAALAGRAGLRSGAGLVTIATPASQQPVIAALGMEVMTEPVAETQSQSASPKAKERILELAQRTEALALGPGVSLDPETQRLVRELVLEVARPMVVDADGLTALAGHLDHLRKAAAPRCLTPHPGEMARLLGVSVSEVQADRIETVSEFCQRYGAYVVLKGARSTIGEPGGTVYINPTGNPGMASGGSGDVLTGMVGAFLARGLDPLAALQAGVFLHGLAGDLARDMRGEEGLIAGDILEAIPPAIAEVQRGGGHQPL
ncbi:MAG: NAD(P)H-hydrate dehydratase [Candidatus Rokubacteria bacterium]|nr:NAD(P)H-hydrate dehydratase [Candidatus Rokubacteria bacterium]